jgi:integrase
MMLAAAAARASSCLAPSGGLEPTTTPQRSEGVGGGLRPTLALRQHRVTQNAERTTKGRDWVESGLVFTTGIGTPIEPRNLNRHFVGLLDKAGLRRIRFHDLRHSCATLLYEQGVEISKIQDILGHSSPRSPSSSTSR